MRIILCILAATFIAPHVFAAPQQRYSGDSVLLNKRLYYFGGRPDNKGNSATIQDLIYLDISESFNVSAAQSAWQGVQVTGSLTAEPNYGYGMGVIPEEHSIMIYGGSGANTAGKLLDNTVMLYNASSNRWETLPEPQTSLVQVGYNEFYTDTQPHARVEVMITKRMFLADAGHSAKDVYPPFTRELNIYDFTTSMWDKGPSLPENMGVRYRTPTTLAGKDLYYIGGSTANYTQTNIIAQDIMIPMSEILIYHIEDMTWEIKQTTGTNTPQPRISHTIAAINETTPIPGDFCYTLDTSSMTWKKQDPIGPGPGPLYGHAAVFADDSPLLFVMFGVNKAGAVQNRFGVLDTDEWKWVDQYNSPYPPQDDGSGNDSGSLSNGAIAGIVVGCAAGVALIAAFCFIQKRRERNGKSKKNFSDGKTNVININIGALAARRSISHFKPEDASEVIPHAILSPLLPAETAPPYHVHIPNEIDPPKASSVQTITNDHATSKPQALRPVKPDGQ
ncbi:hypothetical protein INT45_011496 [Circinella minor]|uniref:Galactose oxidase n=1 Tax=Circinella minor TaxID=1195481 RepID=A0A8H7VIU1_9FUNG|nr:hypothetical protein INT45_011496 [Circinella minor]